jgi:mannosyltransferase
LPQTRHELNKGASQGLSLGQLLSIGVVMIAAASLRFFQIDRASLWWDEGFSVWFSRQGISDLFGVVSQIEPNPPLYYAFLKGWIALVGESDIALRSLSAVCSTATVPLVYLIARWIAPRGASHRTGLLAAALFSLAFLQMRYAQEARAYSLFVLAYAGALASMAYVLQARMQGHMPSRTPFVSLGACVAFMLWSHYTGIVYASLIWVVAALWWMIVERGDRQLLGRLCLSGLCFVVIAGPSLWALIHIHPMDADSWLKAPAPLDLVLLITGMFSANFGANRLAVELAVRICVFGIWPILGLVAISQTRNRIPRAAGFLLLAASIGIVGLIAAITYGGRPILLDRTVVPAQIGWIVLCAFAPLAFTAGYRALPAAAMLLCFSLGAISYVTAKPSSQYHEDWRGMAAEIRNQTTGEVHVFTENGGGVLLEHYFRSKGRVGSIHVAELPTPLSVDIGRAQLASEPPGKARFGVHIETALNSVVSILDQDQSAWLVLRNPRVETIAGLAGSRILPLIQVGPLMAFHAEEHHSRQ